MKRYKENHESSSLFKEFFHQHPVKKVLLNLDEFKIGGYPSIDGTHCVEDRITISRIIDDRTSIGIIIQDVGSGYYLDFSFCRFNLSTHHHELMHYHIAHRFKSKARLSMLIHSIEKFYCKFLSILELKIANDLDYAYERSKNIELACRSLNFDYKNNVMKSESVD